MIIEINTIEKTISVSGDLDMNELQELTKLYPEFKMKTKITEVVMERNNNFYPYNPYPWGQPITVQPYKPIEIWYENGTNTYISPTNTFTVN